MEPDDLLCSRNARSRTPLVGRAQWKINQPPSLRENERAWREHLCCSTRAVKDRLVLLYDERDQPDKPDEPEKPNKPNPIAKSMESP